MADAVCEAYLRNILEEAASIRERLQGPFTPREGGCDELRGRRLALWRDKVAPGADAAFAERLEWLGTTPGAAERLLGAVRHTGAMPRWTWYLGEALARSGPGNAGDFAGLPFGGLIAGFANLGRTLVEPECGDLLTDAAMRDLTAELASELSHIAAPAFYLKFSLLRSAESPGRADPRGTVLFDRFQAGLLQDGLRGFFREFPVLARLLAVTVEDWVRNTNEMAAALRADLPELSTAFADGRDPGRVSGLELSLSDRHNGGRTVSILQFEAGPRIVYKPRNIGIERAWFEFLGELDGLGGDFLRLKVLDKGDHGWVEAAAAAPCKDRAELASYYRRAGMLLCVLYALEASDCFFENIIACGGHPMLIDMETLMHHVLRKEADLSPAEEAADEIIFNSVFRAGFLPAWELGPAGHCVDISGLGAEVGQVTSYVKRSWSHVNRDGMDLGHEPILVDADDHLPRLNGATAKVADHADAVIDGFRAMYRVFMDQATSLTAPDGPLAGMAASEIRLVFHATRIYGLVLKRLGSPRHMRNGVERAIETDVISRFYLEARRKDRFRAILDAELAALERLDIPKFTVPADERSLHLPTGVTLRDIFEEPAIERAYRRINGFNEADLALQSEFIRASLSLSSVSELHEAQALDAAEDCGDTAPMTPKELVDEARAIAEDLASRAIHSTDGGTTWIAPQLLPGANRHELRPLRMDLYSGLAGVAVFFSALQRVTGQGQQTALAALVPLRRYLKTAEPEVMVRDGYTLGAATGAGAFVSSLAWCGEFLDLPELWDEAAAFAHKISARWIGDDDTFDIMAGAAGAIMGLLCLHTRSDAGVALEKAVLCGEHLLAAARPAGAGLAWPTMGEGMYLTGFSHGGAGIAAALERLGGATGDSRFSEAAERAIAFENGLFDQQHQNWLDLRAPGSAEPHFMHTWCHGAPGIGIGRAMAAGKADTARHGRDIDTALRTTGAHGVAGRDGLCCGALGRAELFVVKSLADHDADAEHTSRAWAAQVVRRKRRTGAYRLTGKPGPEFFDPSFFQGLSGIGYQLLRVADPVGLPSVLAWE